MHKNVGKNGKYVRKGYADIFHSVEKNVERIESGEVFSTLCRYDIGNTSPDAVTCVDHSGIESSSPDGPYGEAKSASIMPLSTFFSNVYCALGYPSPMYLMHPSPDVSLR
ncbi:hypothetical protein E5676_scaffold39G00500 [Cucumis melo var. makuwa]|uniref:Uncharacterized protein n=1 Tax=Cucumis melo var. makuwa TaxID=1194695 RepID=A0A5A7V6H9_CUCMM|nr:hypothetical protein E6C27_scaffold455G001450 [Cucumis melo var. makuwa]TYK09878.1 hypothetical protein E5676_scaffold39G00500 [Cucumis melo var. makuwa]